jgi:hypothetical protein
MVSLPCRDILFVGRFEADFVKRMTRMGFLEGARISANDISIACRAAGELIPTEDKDLHFQIAMMFLSLRKRKWDQEGPQNLRDAFAGK